MIALGRQPELVSYALRIAFVALAAVVAEAPARADVFPPQDCVRGGVGSRCQNGGANADEDGTCQSATCNVLSYRCDAGHVGPCGTRRAPCVLCIAADSGSVTGADVSVAVGALLFGVGTLSIVRLRRRRDSR